LYRLLSLISRKISSTYESILSVLAMIAAASSTSTAGTTGLVIIGLLKRITSVAVFANYTEKKIAD